MTFTALSSVTRVAILAMDVAKTADVFATAVQAEGDGALLSQAAAVNQLAILGFSVMEAFMCVSSSSSRSLARLKEVELLPRVANVPFTLLREIDEAARNPLGDEVRAMFRIFERGLLAPYAAAASTACQHVQYLEKYFIEMTPKERQSAKRPIYEYDSSSETWRIKEYVPVDLEDCKARLEAAAKKDFGAAYIRGGRSQCF